MRKNILIVASCFVSQLLLGQVSSDRNYVVSNVVRVPGVTSSAQVDALTVSQRGQEVKYFDGLGR
ncbi:hypothetical protein, partial [Paraflavitalea sp. sgz302555]|uniref:hypothetical protein n=1 Tax=Paraflavitalea sp. sgz302555 TaxID=3424849 RepID=UPI003D356191